MAFEALTIKRYWNADTNDLGLLPGRGVNGDAYLVTVAGSTQLGQVGDWQVNDVACFILDRWVRINGAPDLQIPAYADLRNYIGGGVLVTVQTRAAVGDGGGGTFYYDAADVVSADNGGTILVDILGRRWKRLFVGPVLPHWFGASGNGTDQAAALQAWLDQYKLGYSLYAPPGDYRTSVGLTVMPYTAAAPPTGTTQTPRPTMCFDRKAVFKATAAMTTLLTLGSNDGDFSGCFFDGMLEGGTFDANFLATHAIHAKFFRKLQIVGVSARNALGKYIKMGDNTSPTSFEGIVRNCNTDRDLIPMTITGITKANPAVVSAVNTLVNGEVVCITSAVGMTEVNGLYFTVAGATGASFQLSGVDSTGYGTYTSGGLAYLTVMGKGIAGLYFENSTDNHQINNIIKGTEDGIAGKTVGDTLGLFDNKCIANHVWNYLENGRLRYGYDFGGDNSLVGCQVDGPFQYGYRFTGASNAMVASNVNYTAETYGGRDNTDYAIKIETGGGVHLVACTLKAQSASARLADIAAGPGGDVTHFSYDGLNAINVVATTSVGNVRRDENGPVVHGLFNLSAGVNANAQSNIVTNAGSFLNFAKSTAGGGTHTTDWTGAGDRLYDAGNAGARHVIRFGYATKLIVGEYIQPTLPASAAGLPAGALWNDGGTVKVAP